MILKQTSTLGLYTYDATVDEGRGTDEYINNMSKNMEQLDNDLGPFKQMGLYLDENGDVCQND